MTLLFVSAPIRADEPRARPSAPGVAEIQDRHDRALVRDLVEYLAKNPKADDAEQGFMVLFNKAIDHDWFAETDPVARRYLAERPSGAVRSLAQVVVAMARAQEKKFGEAAALYEELLRGLDRPEQEEFAANFADAVAGAATSGGDYAAARQVYRAVLERFDQSPTLRQKVRDDLARLDRVGRPAPDFAVADIAGKAVRLSDLRGKYVLVDFWATWCAPCIADLPRYQQAYAKYRDQGLEIVSVSLDETAPPVVDFVRARKVPWRQVHNATCGGDLVEAFGVNNIPLNLLIDPEGVITRLEVHGPALDEVLGPLLRRRAAR